jgi:lipopolysaccharide transport system permease protein
MSHAAIQPVEPAATAAVKFSRPTVVIRPTKGWAALNFAELWKYRDLLSILVERDIKLRYKQTALGVIWVVLQPLVAALIFAAIFGRFAKLPSDGSPYLLFVFCGLTAWSYFSQAVLRASNSLVSNSQLVSKVYFPRLLIPLAHTLAVLLDFVVMLIVLLALMAMYRVMPTARILALPFFLLLATLTATGVALWFSALSVKYRDFMYALPFLIQVWMYASPVVYPASIVPDKWQTWYALNPVVGFVEGFRWAALGHSALDQRMLVLTIALSIFAFLSGAFFFRRVERGFADVI